VKEKKMKHKFLFSVMFILIIVGLYVPASYSQLPTYTMTFSNDSLTGGDVYEFDIRIVRTGTNIFQYYGAMFGFLYNTGILNGGTLTAAWVPGSPDTVLVNSNQVNYAFNTTQSPGCIKIAAKIAPNGWGSGAIITNVAPGIRIGRLRITASNGFGVQKADLRLNYLPQPYNSAVFAYDYTTHLSGNITDSTQNIFTLANPTLPVELTSFISNVSGRQVNLNWETKTELNTRQFEIDRASLNTSGSASVWAAVGSVQAAGTSVSPKHYSFTEKNIQAGKYQYRLKMIDNDGSYKYSNLVETEIAVPKEFALSQNYPNPFNPTTKIDYQVPVDAKVILEVYSITGQKVVELVNENQQAGYYSVNFGSSSKLASGVYIYRILTTENATGKNFSSIKKMMLLK
jgi:Secretion system C-terminal sorting domain